jgi:hypothetical protein
MMVEYAKKKTQILYHLWRTSRPEHRRGMVNQPIPIFLDNFILVRDPVLIPSEDSCRIVNTKNVDILYFKSCGLEFVDNPAERTAGIGTRKDILVHEEAPEDSQ